MPKKKESLSAGGSVLLVDDEESIRESLGDLLSACGFTVKSAGSYKEAVKAIAGSKGIEAIVCDMKMPGESGLEVLHYLNDNKINVPLIFLTGYGTLESCQEAVREGAFDYILKPVTEKDDLVLPLKHAVERFRLEKKNMEMQHDILRMAEEHQMLVSQLLDDTETRGAVQQKIQAIVDKWKT